VIGRMLGPYQVLSKLGEGGMGEVYRATDTNLKRQVAIKVLPEAVAADPERLARFQREAEVLAALNHPNIAHIHGLERADGVTALVMELVDGPTLADRIAQGPIPLDEALPVAKQIADALEAAHEQGIIHRDLKPANVKIREDGTVKVLDFGLAKAMEPAGMSGSSSVSMSPTITTPAMTEMGMILGTAAYMAPEQAKGKAVDKRADIWAFGAVLYEMLTGVRAFEGDDVSDTMAAVLRAEVRFDALPKGTPARVRQVLAACLERDRRQRVHDIADVRLALDGAFETTVETATAVPARPPAWRRALPLVTLAAGVVLTAVVAWGLWPTPEPGDVNRFAYEVPEDQTFRRAGRPVVALAPDGRSFVYNTADGLYLREMGELEARLIPGTEEDLSNPFFSPDGQSVGYYASGTSQLKRIAVSGGAPVVITNAGNPWGVTWTAEGDLFFGQADGIHRVAATGGTSELVIAVEGGERVYGPQLLPDGDSVLFSVGTGSWDEAQIVAQSLSTGERTVLVEGGSDARYVPTGHLVYALGGDLLGIAFDADRLAVTGGAVPLVQGLNRNPEANTGTAHYGVSDDGTLVYRSGGLVGSDRGLLWVGPGNQEEPIGTLARGYVGVSLSPSGREAALEIEENGESNVWVTELARGSLVPITTEEGFDGTPVWTPDGQRIVYTSIRDGHVELRSKAADGTGEASTLVAFDETVSGARAASWSPDGSTLAVAVIHPGTGPDVGLVSVEGRGGWQPLIQTAANEGHPVISPDGRLIAYGSNESGANQVWVQRFPGSGDRRQVSVGAVAHHSPVWTRDGQALLFLRGGPPDAVMRATIGEDAAGAPVVGPAEVVLDFPYWSRQSAAQTYDVASDGRILVIARDDAVEAGAEDTRPPIVVVQHWFEELKRLVPTD